MNRYVRILSVSFGQTALPLPMTLRVWRSAEALPAGGDADAFATSVQIARPTIMAELRIRATAAAETLPLGRRDDLRFTVAAGQCGPRSRVVTLPGAVLVAVELNYEQAAMATAVLRFVAEADGGATEPFSAEDSA